MSALSLILIYFCLSVRALVRSKACPKKLNKHRIVVSCINKRSTKFLFNITLSVSIVSRQLLVGYHNIYIKWKVMLIPLMQKVIMIRNAHKYDISCIYFIYIHQVWQHQINIKLYGTIDVSVWHQFDDNS